MHDSLRASNLTFLSAPTSFAFSPISPNISRVDDEELAATACVSPRSADAAWVRLLEQHPTASSTAAAKVQRSLRVGLLGCSTTAGCGALSPTRMCSQELSWGRHFHDALYVHARAANKSPGSHAAGFRSVSTSVNYKNAVEASFFWDCTRALLGGNRDVILLEVFQNMYAHHSLNATVNAMRRALPNAAIVFVSWLKPHHMMSPTERNARHRDAASALGVDLVDVPSALHVLHKRGPPASESLYARTPSGGQDHHPNRRGHELIGLLAARCVARRLGWAGISSSAARIRAIHVATSAQANGPSVGTRMTVGGVANAVSSDRGTTPAELATAKAHERLTPDELCYNAADQMPVVLPRHRPAASTSRVAATIRPPAQGSTGIQPVAITGGHLGANAGMMKDTIVGGGGISSSSSGLVSMGPSDSPGLRSAGFSLVDDGVAKGVRKLGYASSQVGDRIMIGPLNLPHSTHGGRGCHGTVRVRLGYLVSTHPGMGALNLKCSSSCGCRPIKSTFLRRVLPFPRLETNGRASGSPLQLVDANESVSITAYTIFIAKLPNVSSSSMHGGASSRAGSGARGCYVEVSHVRAHGVPRSSTSSRVRLDSLAIMEHDGMRGPTVPCA